MARQEETAEAEKAPAKSRKKIYIIAGVALLVAALAGGGVYYSQNNQSDTSAAEAGTAKPAAAKKKEIPVMYPLEAFVVNINDGNDMRYLKVKVELQTGLDAEKAKNELDPYLPPLRDSILVLLTTKTIQDVRDLPGKNRLREEILAAAKKIMPQGKISSVYFTDFVVQ